MGSRIASPTVDGRSAEEQSYHLQLLLDAGFIAHESGASGKREWSGYRLTWSGHEFLDAAREGSRWRKAKGLVESAGGVTFDVLKAVLIELARKQVGL